MLAKDHGLDSSAHLCFVNIGSLELIYSMKSFFQNFQRTVIVNKTPLKVISPKTKESSSTGLCVYKSFEFENRYEVDVSLNKVNISNTNGKEFKSFDFKSVNPLFEFCLLSRCCCIN